MKTVVKIGIAQFFLATLCFGQDIPTDRMARIGVFTGSGDGKTWIKSLTLKDGTDLGKCQLIKNDRSYLDVRKDGTTNIVRIARLKLPDEINREYSYRSQVERQKHEETKAREAKKLDRKIDQENSRYR